ncbi:hypothetical protein [Acinetobacter bereziniae]|uniref:hypothetical protein n=1 Tax=Acinetobacter bereziniae TaxID=106648 RepID=UPI00208F852B|nr:hypothetical protein [Acinetobacter bereziniae]
MTAKKTPETAATVEQPENNDCFIIMPIADHPDYKQGHFKRVYDDIFAPACLAAGYKPIRADDVAQTNLIHLDILQKLLESPMAICDLSTRNPNVLFELGLRQAFDKPTVLVQEVGTPQIFDINLFRYTQYRNELDYRDVLADQKTIQKVLEETKLAVQENKSVNSIIKLLSITNPATLQDTTNFGEKEYFSILMSELGSLKKELINTQRNNGDFIVERKYDNKSNIYLVEIMFNRILNNMEVDLIIQGISSSSMIDRVETVVLSHRNDDKCILKVEVVTNSELPFSNTHIVRKINIIKIDDLEILDISKIKLN